jgi:hypothetical protein
MRKPLAWTLRVEGRALADAEAVLLVDHGDRERGELDGLLDQGVGADDELGLPGGERGEQLAALGRRCR